MNAKLNTEKLITSRGIRSWTCSIVVFLACAVGNAPAAEAVVNELMTKALANVPGKEGTMLIVTYPPGSKDPVHRHNASAFVYVLEGAIVMQVKAGKEVTLHPGETFFEGPKDVHIVGRNASTTEPAKFLVVLVKDQGAPVLVPVKE
jgi:quercetin dioxygenase-like cupin family protein